MRRFAGTLLVASAALCLVATASAASWRELHRPLDLPRVQPGQACPVSQVDPAVDWPSINIFGASGIGPGPVYPGLGSSDGHLQARPGSVVAGGWYREKVFWYVAPTYRDRVLIRGRRIDGPERLRFHGRRRSELRIGPGAATTWSGHQPDGSRGRASGVLFRATGCYAVQVDGSDFTRTVVFRASTP